MDDRLLLELAAKAAGKSLRAYDWHEAGFFLVAGDASHFWNPLTDDGDALRLAVALLLEVNCTIPDKPTISVYGNNHGRMVACHEQRSPNPYAATRRAIVRAAAAIGQRLAATSSGDAL